MSSELPHGRGSLRPVFRGSGLLDHTTGHGYTLIHSLAVRDRLPHFRDRHTAASEIHARASCCCYTFKQHQTPTSLGGRRWT